MVERRDLAVEAALTSTSLRERCSELGVLGPLVLTSLPVVTQERKDSWSHTLARKRQWTHTHRHMTHTHTYTDIILAMIPISGTIVDRLLTVFD